MVFLKLLLLASFYQAPWGKDAALTKPQKPPTHQNHTAATGMIRLYQKYISPVTGPHSQYRPSSSQYTLLAMRKYGFFKGYMMGCSRLMRENKDPWVYRTIEMHGYTYKEDKP